MLICDSLVFFIDVTLKRFLCFYAHIVGRGPEEKVAFTLAVGAWYTDFFSCHYSPVDIRDVNTSAWYTDIFFLCHYSPVDIS